VSVTELPPPRAQIGAGAWLRQNLFSNWSSSLLTVALGSGLILFLLMATEWS
jgi:hypothetical protein